MKENTKDEWNTKDECFQACIFLTSSEYRELSLKAIHNGKGSIKDYLLDLARKDNGRRIG